MLFCGMMESMSHLSRRGETRARRLPAVIARKLAACQWMSGRICFINQTNSPGSRRKWDSRWCASEDNVRPPECRGDQTLMPSLGARIEFVQKISALSDFRSIHADFSGTDAMLRSAGVKMCPEIHQESTSILANRGLPMSTCQMRTTEFAGQSRQFGRRLQHPGEDGILHRDDNPWCMDGPRVRRFRLRNTQRDGSRRV